MALYTRKQFQDLCGVDRAYLAVYVKRGKLILTGEMIDDTIPQNKDFLDRQISKLKAASNSQEKSIPAQQVIKNDEPGENNQQLRHNFSKNNVALDLELKNADLAKKEVDTRIALLKEEKLRGTVIPTDIVKVVFTQHFKSVTSAFHQAADNLIVNIAKKKDLNREEVADIRGILIEIINEAVKDSIDESKNSITNIIAEYSDKKGIGERA